MTFFFTQIMVKAEIAHGQYTALKIPKFLEQYEFILDILNFPTTGKYLYLEQ